MTVETAVKDAGSRLIDRLGPEEDEITVVTIAARQLGDDWLIVAASILVGPDGMARHSWVSWYELNQGDTLATESLLEGTDHPLSSWIAFDYHVDGWRFIRFPVPLDDVRPLLTRAIEHGSIALPSGETVQITLQNTPTFLWMLTHETTAASRLVAAAGRPVLGWYFPLDVPEEFISDASDSVHLPQEWNVDGISVSGGALLLAGLSSAATFGPDGSQIPDLTPGLVIGRLSRDAWLGNFRGGPGLDTFEVRILREEAGVMLWDLELDIEERDGKNLLSARRLRLGDIALPSVNATDVKVVLPTLGSRITRRVRLFDRTGYLLDGSDDFNLVEQVTFKIHAGGTTVTASTAAITRPTVIDRIDRMDHAESQFSDLLESGLAGRIVSASDDGRTRLSALLLATQGELLIFDSYFGNMDDWKVLCDVKSKIRVLTGNGGRRPPSSLSMKSASVLVKRWAGAARNPPFHDRAYLWDGGGLLVGTSPSGLGNRLALIDPLPPITVKALTAAFEIWWSAPDFVVI